MRPLMDVSVQPRSEPDAEKLREALAKMAADDPMFSYHTDNETGQTILHGMGESHLDNKIDLLRRSYEVNAAFGSKQVAYLETLGRKAEIKYTHKKQSGGSGQYAEVRVIFEPLERNEGVVFVNKVAGNAVPPEYIPAVEKGIRAQAVLGVLAGFPTVDFKCTLIDGKWHHVDSSPLAFEIAAKACFRELRTTGSPKILEPIMTVEVLCPREFVGTVIDDLRNRRGQINDTEFRGGAQMVTASVPLADLFGYADVLSALGRGRAQFTMQYENHREAPLSVPPDDLFPSAIAMRA
jgi:elongation factor G